MRVFERLENEKSTGLKLKQSDKKTRQFMTWVILIHEVFLKQTKQIHNSCIKI